MATRPRRGGIGLRPEDGGRPVVRVGWTLPVALAATFGVAGCRGDGTSPAKPPFIPDRWLQRSAPADEADLKPVPEAGSYDAPPLPGSWGPKTGFSPPPAPIAEPVSAVQDAGDPFAFYGVRRMSGELAVPPEQSWADRFRKLFVRAETSAPPAARPLPPLAAAEAAVPMPIEPAEQPPQPPRPVSAKLGVPATAVVLAPPVFEDVRTRTTVIRPSALERDRLPAIRPGRSLTAARAADPATGEPAPWPRRAMTVTQTPGAGSGETAEPAEAVLVATSPSPDPTTFGPAVPEPLMAEPSPPDLLPTQTAEAMSGPALLR